MKILVLTTHDDESDLATTVHASTEAAYRTLRDYLVNEYEMEPEAASDEMTKADIDLVTEAADGAALFTWSLTEHEVAELDEIRDDLAELRTAVWHCGEAWESGDLAGAVNEAVGLLPDDFEPVEDPHDDDGNRLTPA